MRPAVMGWPIPSNKTLTIADDDGAIALSAAPASVAESAGSTEVTVTATLPDSCDPQCTATAVTVKVGRERRLPPRRAPTMRRWLMSH